MFSLPSASAVPDQHRPSAVAPASITLLRMFSSHGRLISRLSPSPADEKEDCDGQNGDRDKGRRDRIDLGRDDTAELAEHIGRQRILPRRFPEFGCLHLISLVYY